MAPHDNKLFFNCSNLYFYTAKAIHTRQSNCETNKQQKHFWIPNVNFVTFDNTML